MQEDLFDSPDHSNGDLKTMLRAFLAERLEKRLSVQKDEQKRQALIERFKYENWFEYVVGKLQRLRAATHVAKYSHPSVSKAADLYAIPDTSGKENLVGTHLFDASQLQGDLAAPGGAADLDADIKELLRLQYEGKTVFDGILSQDATLRDALNEDHDKADAIMRGLGCITESLNPRRAHALVKQIYWLVGDESVLNDQFLLLAPLHATSLTNKVFHRINESRFGEHAKEARKARRGDKAFIGGYHDYLNLTVQKMGGSNQQNVSQLNSERGGQNYLLASLPPNWKSREVYAPMRDVFRAFKGRPDVRRIVGELKRFLETDPARNMHTRDLRDDLTAMLVDELMLFTFDIHSLAPGWTADEKCQLALEEQYWLDPGRAQEDAEFAEARGHSDWHEAVSSRAANWLNRELNDKSSLSFGDAEHHHWKRRFEGIVTEFRRQLDDLQEALRDEGDDPEGEAA